ncbi:MAG: hypothetical protein ABH833_04075 [Parcubacteria group bacterium]
MNTMLTPETFLAKVREDKPETLEVQLVSVRIGCVYTFFYRKGEKIIKIHLQTFNPGEVPTGKHDWMVAWDNKDVPTTAKDVFSRLFLKSHVGENLSHFVVRDPVQFLP